MRRGEFRSAIASLEQSQSQNPNDRCRAINLSIIAIANQKLNQHAEAGKSLSEAAELIDELNAVPEHQGHHDLLIAKILHGEAAAKISGAVNP